MPDTGLSSKLFLHDNIYLIIFIFFYDHVRIDKDKYC